MSNVRLHSPYCWGVPFSKSSGIIVRDDASRAQLLDELGHQKGGLVSTILNSKGMEYDDVRH
jgi:hypothetical protein